MKSQISQTRYRLAAGRFNATENTQYQPVHATAFGRSTLINLAKITVVILLLIQSSSTPALVRGNAEDGFQVSVNRGVNAIGLQQD